MSARRALILGVNGQDGSYTADLLLSKDYEVYGMVNRSPTDNLKHLYGTGLVKIIKGDMLDTTSLYKALMESKPDEVYNQADQDSIPWSEHLPVYQSRITCEAVILLLDIIATCFPDTRLFQPLSAAMFGKAGYPQDETTIPDPETPYAIAKTAAWNYCRYYRERKGVKVSCGILFNHDSPRRSEDYLMNKICHSVARIATGKQEHVTVGNTSQIVDIGISQDFVTGEWLTLQNPPDDYVFATGSGITIMEVLHTAFYTAGMQNYKDWQPRIRIDPQLNRPVRTTWVGNPAKARKILGWSGRTTFETARDLTKHFLAIERDKGKR